MKPVYLYLIIIALFSCSKKKVEESLEVKNPHYYRAYDFYNEELKDSAFLNFSQAKDVFLEDNDSVGVANCLLIMAVIQKDQGDYFGAQETALEALSFLNTKDTAHSVYLSNNYNNLGAATSELGDKENAIAFYQEAIKFATDSSHIRAYRNNIGTLYQGKKDFPRALSIYSAVLKEEKKNSVEFARTLTNYATTMWQYRANYNPIPEFKYALDIRKKEKDKWGQNSSYAHLADYYEKINPDSSLYFAQRQYAMAKEIDSPKDQVNALKRLIRLNPSDSITTYFAIYQKLTDSIQQARAAAKNQFALIRYEVEKNKSENLKLQKDNAETRGRLTVLSIVFVVVGVGGVLWYKKRRQRLELEAQSRVKETQLHLSKKIHDVVANGLYRVMTEFEYKEEIDREGMLDKLDYMYNQSRDISHNVEQQTITKVAYNEEIAALLKSFAHDKRRILIAGNDAEQWDTVGKRAKEEIKHVLQELMVNMRKHSQAEQVVVRFEKVDQQLHIYYSDNGIGLQAKKSTGKGLSNTVSRMESLGGSVTFVSEPGEGLSVTVHIPLF